MKALGHLVEAQAPLNYKQLERLGLSMFPVDSKPLFKHRVTKRLKVFRIDTEAQVTQLLGFAIREYLPPAMRMANGVEV